MHPSHQQWQCYGTEYVDAGVSRVIGDAAQCDGERLGGHREGGREAGKGKVRVGDAAQCDGKRLGEKAAGCVGLREQGGWGKAAGCVGLRGAGRLGEGSRVCGFEGSRAAGPNNEAQSGNTKLSAHYYPHCPCTAVQACPPPPPVAMPPYVPTFFPNSPRM